MLWLPRLEFASQSPSRLHHALYPKAYPLSIGFGTKCSDWRGSRNRGNRPEFTARNDSVRFSTNTGPVNC